MLRADKEVITENLFNMVVKQINDLFNSIPSVGSLHSVIVE